MAHCFLCKRPIGLGIFGFEHQSNQVAASCIIDHTLRRMAIAVGIGAVSMLIVARAEKVALSTYAQGAPFEKCISIADFEGKTLADEIDLVDMVGGCCPSGSVPGAKWYTSYKGAQIVCGFKDDGSVSITTGSSNGA